MSDSGDDDRDSVRSSEVDEWDEEDWTKDKNGYHERELYAPKMLQRWHFLKPYFKRVAKRCWFSEPDRDNTHAVRIGREVHEWWTDVPLESLELDPRKGEKLATRSARYRDVGEALRIMAVLAHVDYQSWLGEFIRGSQYLVQKFMKLREAEPLPRQFAFTFRADLSPVFYHWELLHHALSTDNDSAEFKRDMEKILATAQTFGMTPKTFRKKNAPPNWRDKLLDPIPIKLVVEPNETALRDQVLIVQGVTKTVLKLQEIEAAHAGSVPVFHIESADLDLREFDRHPDLLRAVCVCGVLVT